MENRELAQNIVQYMGGQDNIIKCWHCVTRLRFNVKDESKIEAEKIKGLPGTMGYNAQNGQYQVIIGGNVGSVFEELEGLLNGREKGGVDPAQKMKKTPAGLFNAAIDVISGCVTPILPAIIGAGMLKGLIAVLLLIGAISDTGTNYQILSLMADAPFYFLPFLVAVSASKKFAVNTYLGLWLAGCLLYPTLVNSYEAGALKTMSFFKMPVLIVNYTCSIIPIILGVYVLSIFYRAIDKRVPAALKLIVSPTVTMLITIPLVLAALGPAATYLSVYLEKGIAWLFSNTGALAGAVFGGLLAPIVITGMHYAFYPSIFQSLADAGFDYFFMCVGIVSNLAQCAAAFAVMCRIKDKKEKSVALSTGVTALFGVTEPAMYAVTLKYRRSFYFALLGSALGGAYVIGMGVKGFAFATPGIAALPLMIDTGNRMNFIHEIIGLAIGMGTTFGLTYFFGIPESAQKKETGFIGTKSEPLDIISPMSGHMIPLNEVKDNVFSSAVIGMGAAVDPTDGNVVSPADGTIIMVADTKHAVGIKTADGTEILIHIGLDTVALNGQYFETFVEQNQTVHAGDPLLKIDLEEIKKTGIDLTSPVIISGTSNAEAFTFHHSASEITGGQSLLYTFDKTK